MARQRRPRAASKATSATAVDVGEPERKLVPEMVAAHARIVASIARLEAAGTRLVSNPNDREALCELTDARRENQEAQRERNDLVDRLAREAVEAFGGRAAVALETFAYTSRFASRSAYGKRVEAEWSREIAEELATYLRPESPKLQHASICIWLSYARKIRHAVLIARRRVRNRRYADKEKESAEIIWQTALGVAASMLTRTELGVVTSMLPKGSASDKTDECLEIVYSAVGALAADMSGSPDAAELEFAPWDVGERVIHEFLGRRGVLAREGFLRTRADIEHNTLFATLHVGVAATKADAPKEIAAGALRLLGHKTADIHRTLQRAGLRKLRDRAVVRRLVAGYTQKS